MKPSIALPGTRSLYTVEEVVRQVPSGRRRVSPNGGTAWETEGKYVEQNLKLEAEF